MLGSYGHNLIDSADEACRWEHKSADGRARDLSKLPLRRFIFFVGHPEIIRSFILKSNEI
jgi:hypothetical protein